MKQRSKLEIAASTSEVQGHVCAKGVPPETCLSHLPLRWPMLITPLVTHAAYRRYEMENLSRIPAYAMRLATLNWAELRRLLRR